MGFQPSKIDRFWHCYTHITSPLTFDMFLVSPWLINSPSLPAEVLMAQKLPSAVMQRFNECSGKGRGWWKMKQWRNVGWSIFSNLLAKYWIFLSIYPSPLNCWSMNYGWFFASPASQLRWFFEVPHHRWSNARRRPEGITACVGARLGFFGIQ